MTESEALLELLDMTQAGSYPILPEAEAKRILKRHKKASVWSPGAAVSVGDKCVPATGNGRMYRCLRGGTTGVVSPFNPFPRGRQYSNFLDDEVIWEDAGPAPACLWDLNGATNAGWMAKAGKVAGDFDFKDEGQTLTRSQVHANCVSMAATFQPAFIA